MLRRLRLLRCLLAEAVLGRQGRGGGRLGEKGIQIWDGSERGSRRRRRLGLAREAAALQVGACIAAWAGRPGGRLGSSKSSRRMLARHARRQAEAWRQSLRARSIHTGVRACMQRQASRLQPQRSGTCPNPSRQPAPTCSPRTPRRAAAAAPCQPAAPATAEGQHGAGVAAWPLEARRSRCRPTGGPVVPGSAAGQAKASGAKVSEAGGRRGRGGRTTWAAHVPTAAAHPQRSKLSGGQQALQDGGALVRRHVPPLQQAQHEVHHSRGAALLRPGSRHVGQQGGRRSGEHTRRTMRSRRQPAEQGTAGPDAAWPGRRQRVGALGDTWPCRAAPQLPGARAPDPPPPQPWTHLLARRLLQRCRERAVRGLVGRAGHCHVERWPQRSRPRRPPRPSCWRLRVLRRRRFCQCRLLLLALQAGQCWRTRRAGLAAGTCHLAGCGRLGRGQPGLALRHSKLLQAAEHSASKAVGAMFQCTTAQQSAGSSAA